jgi:hypothetical protein
VQVAGNTVQLTGVPSGAVNSGMFGFNQQNPALLSQQALAAHSSSNPTSA